MRIEQRQWTEGAGWSPVVGASDMPPVQLVLFFAANSAITASNAIDTLMEGYPGARILGCSTAGEICGTSVADGTIVATAIHFEHTSLRMAYRTISDPAASAAAGEQLARDLPAEGLAHVFVLAEGLKVNGSELVKGLREGLQTHVAVTGGLAGDGERFHRTTVSLDRLSTDGGVAVVGFYGDRLSVGYGSMGGWDQFGPERLVTRSEANILYELDGAPALDLYKRYLGPYAAGLPASGLLFPLSLRGNGGDPGIVRTILGIDEEAGSLVFAGDVPQNGYVRLMKANVDRLIDGAHGAADASFSALGTIAPDLAILISCVGRKLVLKQRVEEELESVRGVLGDGAVMTGFYSYGEIAPFMASAKCELHNQTMTITTFAER